ncbi:STAS-like domain-containing protein [Francisellaceae bacterium CB300]
MENLKNNQGTSVSMVIKKDSKTMLSKVFDEYAEADEFAFNKTVVPVKLAKMGHENLVSRSQAKRVLLRLENFKTVIFDFDEVDKIGQAFADEIFRVYQNKHLDISLEYENVSLEVEKMIQRALINRKV